MTSHEILRLLRTKHKDDVWSEELPIAPGNRLRLDGWAMAVSHSKPCVTGYEIKVTRQDFLGDRKMHLYLPACNQAYLVTPKDLVSPEELPEGFGLMYVTAQGKALRTLRKAPYRQEGLDLEAVYKQALFRLSHPEKSKEDRVEEYRRYIRELEDRKNVGRTLSRMIRRDRDLIMRDVRDTEKRLERIRVYEEALGELGINLDRPPFYSWKTSKEDVREILEEHLRGDAVIDDAVGSLERVVKRLETTAKELNDLKERRV